MEDCVFCGIVQGSIPARKVFEDETVVAFWDIRPVAPVHLLVIPKPHVTSLARVTPQQWPVVMRCLEVVNALAHEQGAAASGYRVVTNIGDDGGQTVGHLHWHLLAGRFMAWPPG